MAHVRLRDLLVAFSPDGRVVVRSASTGIGVKAPPWIVGVLAACSEPVSRERIAAQLGAPAAGLYDQCVELGLLVSPDRASDTPVIYGNYSGIEVHRRMLVDEVRLRGYADAARAVIREGDVVIDAGSGTGVLAVQAALAGASRVYAIEKTEFAEVIAQVARDSGVADRITVVRGDFGQVKLPEKARVIITETYGGWAFGEGMMPDLQACARNNLAEGGVIIPNAVTFWLAPLSKAPDILLRPFRRYDDGLDLTSLLQDAKGRASIQWVDAETVGQAVEVTTVPMPCDGTMGGEVEIEGPAEALVAWYDLHMAPGLVLSTSPLAPWTHWKQSVVPVSLPPGRHRLTLTGVPAPEDGRSLCVTFAGEGIDQQVRFR